MNFLDLREPVSSWSHFTGLLLALPGTVLLLRRSGGHPGHEAAEPFVAGSDTSPSAYSASTPSLRASELPAALWIAAFASPGRRRNLRPDRRGSYTPLASVPDAGPMAAVDAGDRLGCGGHRHDHWIATGRHFLRPFAPATGLYLSRMGWGALALLFRDLAQVGVAPRVRCRRRRRPLHHSLGAVLNLLHWPVLLPGIFGAHELFHMFVLAGSLAHYRFILKVVVPFAPTAAQPIPGVASLAHDLGSAHGRVRIVVRTHRRSSTSLTMPGRGSPRTRGAPGRTRQRCPGAGRRHRPPGGDGRHAG